MDAHRKDKKPKSAEKPKANGISGNVEQSVNDRVDHSVDVSKSSNPVDVSAPHLKVNPMAGAGAFMRSTP
jgi:hypothetical protein